MRKKGIVILISVAAVLAVGALLWFTGVLGTRIGYANAAAYTAGEADIAEAVSKLDIHWISGTVRIARHGENTVLLRESADRQPEGDMQLRWWLEDGTLHVQYGRDGARLPWRYHKDLTLTLPEGLALEETDIHVISGDLEIPDLRTDELNVKLTTGRVSVKADARSADVAATSCDITLALTGTADEVTAHTTTGDVTVTAEQVNRFSAESVTGDVRATLQSAGSAHMSSTTGSVTASLARFDSLDVHVTTGSVTAFLPERPGFTAGLHKVTGSVSCELPAVQQGGEYVVGDGSARVDIGVTTGNITLKALAE